jgi:hypothetical protein
MKTASRIEDQCWAHTRSPIDYYEAGILVGDQVVTELCHIIIQVFDSVKDEINDNG